MSKLSFSDRHKIPRYDDPKQIEMGVVEFDPGKCDGCGLCAKACPADAIVMSNKKAVLADRPECMACADCVAICSENAIRLVRNYRYTGIYKTIDQGELAPPRL